MTVKNTEVSLTTQERFCTSLIMFLIRNGVELCKGSEFLSEVDSSVRMVKTKTLKPVCSFAIGGKLLAEAPNLNYEFYIENLKNSQNPEEVKKLSMKLENEIREFLSVHEVTGVEFITVKNNEAKFNEISFRLW